MGLSPSSEVPLIGRMSKLKEDCQLYKLIDLHGSGDMIIWMRYADRTGDHSIIDEYVESKMKEFMYNNGKGKLTPITELVKLRNKDRNAMLGAFSRKKGRGKSGPNILDDFNQDTANNGDLQKALKLLDGGGKGGKNESKYREVSWKLDERGSMGETIIGVCLLNGSSIHNKLIMKLLNVYPKLLNDISVSEDYYGLSPLHQTVVNQDIPLLAFILKKGADVNMRCFGAYFCADDQKEERIDSLEHEYVELPVEDTNYTGRMYFGEYPLSFAACIGNPDCYRLLIAYKANPNAQDTNGNTVLHMCVIHEKLKMLRLSIEIGANPHIKNKQKLTALTLSAKLAKKRMFMELIEIEGLNVWDYSNSNETCYPLSRIDTINEENGDLDDTSALSLAVYGTKSEHLDLLDGILEKLLKAKWKTFARREWFKSLSYFSIYYIFLLSSFMQRPFSMTTEFITKGAIDGLGRTVSNVTYYDDSWSRCQLYDYSSLGIQGWTRFSCEGIVILLVIIQIYLDIEDIYRIGINKWINIYKSFPAKILYKISWILVLCIIPMRFICFFGGEFLAIDNHLSCLALVSATVHFLFYCRAIEFIGPFVQMLYTIIARDLLRFMLIYLIFNIGFSQSFYIIFFMCESSAKSDDDGKHDWTNIMSSPQESFIRTFIMTMGEFSIFYRRLHECPNKRASMIGKGFFLIFELCVSILQLNLLIAMMTRTYEEISKSRKEHKRQWAKVILMLEVSLKPNKRLEYLNKYTVPTGTDKKRRSFVVQKKVDINKLDEAEKEKMDKKKTIIEEEKAMLKRKKKAELEIKAGRLSRKENMPHILVSPRI